MCDEKCQNGEKHKRECSILASYHNEDGNQENFCKYFSKIIFFDKKAGFYNPNYRRGLGRSNELRVSALNTGATLEGVP